MKLIDTITLKFAYLFSSLSPARGWWVRLSDCVRLLSDGVSPGHSRRDYKRNTYPLLCYSSSACWDDVPRCDSFCTVVCLCVFFLWLRLIEAPAYLIDLMHDKNAEIRKVCDNTLDIIAVSMKNGNVWFVREKTIGWPPPLLCCCWSSSVKCDLSQASD